MQTHLALAVGSILLFSKIGTYQRGGGRWRRRRGRGRRGEEEMIHRFLTLAF